ncbi:MAG: response regulator [Candidatus Omnitrophota bacterium]|nr:response regulator [bacterium]MBU4123705.1 response regulator [bacterium]
MVKETAYIIAEDKDFAAKLKGVIESDYIVTLFESPEEAIDEILKKKPDVVVSEMVFSSIDGINFAAGLKEKCLESPLVILTKLHPTPKVAELLGIAGCFNRDLSDEDMLDKIKSLSGWKKRKVSPPQLPIITEGSIGIAIQQLLNEVYNEKKNECLACIGKKDFARALEIATFLRRVFPTDLRTQGLIREIVHSKEAESPKTEQTSFSASREDINRETRAARGAVDSGNLALMLESAKKLLLMEDVKNGIRLLRESVVFSEENPYLAERIVIQKESSPASVLDILCAGSVFLSFFIYPYVFAGVGICFGIAAWAMKKERKAAAVAVPMAVVIIALNFFNFPLLSGMVADWQGKAATRRIFSVEPKIFNPGSDTLIIKYRVKEISPVVITAASSRQSAEILNNKEHDTGVFEIPWKGKTDDGSLIKNNFRVRIKIGDKSFTEKIYTGD